MLAHVPTIEHGMTDYYFMVRRSMLVSSLMFSKFIKPPNKNLVTISTGVEGMKWFRERGLMKEVIWTWKFALYFVICATCLFNCLCFSMGKLGPWMPIASQNMASSLEDLGDISSGIQRPKRLSGISPCAIRASSYLCFSFSFCVRRAAMVRCDLDC